MYVPLRCVHNTLYSHVRGGELVLCALWGCSAAKAKKLMRFSSAEVAAEAASLGAGLKEERATVKRMKGELQTMEEEVAEVKGDRDALSKVGRAGGV